MMNDVQHVFIDLDIMYVIYIIYVYVMHRVYSAAISDIAVAGRGPVAWG